MSQRKGHCLCGAVQYQISEQPVQVRICWCRDCQRLAANGTVNMVVADASLQISGGLSEYSAIADSGNQMRRRFCPHCGSQLFSNSSGRPGYTVVRVGTLDDPSSVQPTMNIWTRSAPAWACLDPALERIEQQPAPPPR